MSLENLSYPNRIDTPELARIKNKFALRDRANSENSELIKREARNPAVTFNRLSTPDSLGAGTLRGLSYPLELDGSGGLKIASGLDRIGQAIREVFETRIGERIGSPFLGVRELLFETVSEDVEAQSIKRQILSAVPYLSTDRLSVSLRLGEDGTCYILASYVVEGGENVLVDYSFR
jgi:hypothetical protein